MIGLFGDVSCNLTYGGIRTQISRAIIVRTIKIPLKNEELRPIV